MAVTTTVYSYYEVRLANVKIGENVWPIKCIGKFEEAMEARTVTKKCRGVVAKQRTKGTGAGTCKVSAHIPLELYHALHGMDSDDLADGVYAYGTKSMHPIAVVTLDVYDEDDVEMFRAYPVCTVTTGPNRNTENGADEVAEVELEIGVAPDDNGYGVYEALAEGLSESIKTAWMENFTPTLVTTATV
ncbi:MAG: phage tail protein [Clostridia bacterium]|nr:phage tail protein [Clostridia bacterium]MBQ9785125.1 phage tail protein [Clostridia bacterium]